MDLKRRLEQKTAQLAALRQIGQAINAAWELRDTLELITRKTAEVMGMDSCSIYLLDPEGEHLVLEATTGLAAEAVGRARLRLGEGLTGWAAAEGKPVGVADAARDPRFKFLPETRETVFQSLLAVPLINQGRVIGAMNVQTRAYHEFSAEEVELLSLIGDLAAGALEKAMLYERMQRQIAELTTLAEVSKTITAPLYLDQMLGLIVDMAARVMRAKVCSLMLLDEAEGVLVLRATQTVSPAYRNRPPLRIGEGIAGLVAQTGEPITVADVRTDPRYRYRDIARAEGLCSLLCVPLRVRDRVIGVLNCYTGKPHTFTPQEVGLFQTLANQTALAIENARLVVNTAVVREMHHRVKNNLQTVAMLLRLQMTEGSDLDPRQALQESINRVLSIAAVHEILSEKGFHLVDVRQVLQQVARTVVQNRPHPDKDIRVEVEGDEIALPSRSATALALAVNELVQNALKHAFVGRETGHIEVSLRRRPSGYEVVVADDGVGLPVEAQRGHGRVGEDTQRSLGLQIVETLVTQDLGGKLELEYGERGTKAVIRVEEVG